MNQADLEPIVIVAMLAAQADGQTTLEELTRLKASVGRLGVTDPDGVVQRLGAGQLDLTTVAKRFSSDEARHLAYQIALFVCQTDGWANEAETKFLTELRGALGLDPAAVEQDERAAATLAKTPVIPSVGRTSTTSPSSDSALDKLILNQAMLTGALELLPEGLANLAILPLQLRLVYQIGQLYGQQLDTNQIKDLAATLGIGAAAQAMEGVVRKLVGGVGGILGGLIGGAAGIAAGAAVTFASTYALGHVAKQYYAQGRKLSADDLRALFSRFKGEAEALFPKMQDQIRSKAKSLNLQNVMGMLQ